MSDTLNRQTAKGSIKRLPSVKRSPISLSQETLVKTSFLPSGGPLPVVMQPVLEGVNLAVWAKSSLGVIEKALIENGGLLLRGFDITSEADFEEFLTSISLNLMHYIEGATPRTQISEKIYTSTEYPADQHIALHNELTYIISWPMRILFFCSRPADENGETPIADVRGVFRRIDLKIREKFISKGWMLLRNYGDGLSLSWESAFRTSDRLQVEDYCRKSQVEYEWKENNRLRTRQVRPAVARHPRTREMVWFNHVAFWHVSSLDPKVREAVQAVFKEEDLPYNTYYGDGSPIEDSVVEEIREAYRLETIEFSWQRGDVLLLENMLVAHGRNPFKGPRRILAAMGDACSDRGLI